MHTLRKKLESYYKSDGIDDKVRLQIPKGHYAIKFTTKSDKNDTESGQHPSKRNIIYTLSIIIILTTSSALIFGLWRNNIKIKNKLKYYQLIDEENPIWKDFLQSDLQTSVVLGNHFFYTEYSENLKKWRYMRDLTVNTSEDLELYKKQYPNKQINETNEAYFPDSSVWGIPPILKLFYSVPKPIKFRRVKDITPQSIYNNNVIFLGSIKTLGIFDQYISGSHFIYELIPHRPFRTTNPHAEGSTIEMHKLIYTPADGSAKDTLTTSYNQSTGFHRDLALALKLPGPNNNTILIITSFYSSGIPEVAKYLTNPSTLKQLEEKFIQTNNEIPQYFEILFEIRGVIKTGFYIEAKYANRISDDVKIW